MRLSLVIPSLQGGGAERFAANFANYWSLAGHELSIITFDGDLSAAYNVHPNVRIITLAKRNSRNALDALTSNLMNVLRIRRALNEIRPSIVVGIIEWASILVAIASIGAPWRTIGSERTYPPEHRIPAVWTFLRRYIYRALDLVVAQTSTTASWLAQNTFAKHIVVIPNSVTLPIPASNVVLNPDTVCTADRKIVLACGRLGPEKCFGDLIADFSIAAKDRAEWSLVILGEGPERHTLEKVVTQYGMEGRVLLPGRAGNMTDWYARASIFALSSRFEGFPNVLLEALAHGVASISMNCNAGPRDMIKQGINGILVSPGDHKQFTEELTRLIDDAPLRQRLGEQARAVNEKFSEERVMTEWEACFQKLNEAV